jgi:putative ABC transport system permease protein
VLKLALKGLLARKLRTVLTGFAVVLGVAFVVGTFVYTDTIDASFKDLFERTSVGVDVAVTTKLAVERQFGEQRPMPESVLGQVSGVDGVAAVTGSVSGNASLFGRDGKLIQSGGPGLVVSAQDQKRFEALDYPQGAAPSGPGEVALDKATADKRGFKVGDQIKIAGRAPARSYRVAGIATLGDLESFGLPTAIMVRPEAQRVLGLPGRLTEVDAAAAGGTSPDELKARIAARLGGGYVVRTGKEQAEKAASDISNALGFIKVALLVFAGVALFVGAFLIYNTFAVTVAQRSRELALLRVLGASRGQLLRSVLAETAVIGVLASAVGIAVGLVLAPALRALLNAFGLTLPSTVTVIEPRTIVVGFAVGILATMISGFVPARRATRVEPVAAMREAVTPGAGRLRRRRVVLAIALVVVGLAGLFGGLFGGLQASAAASLLGLGAVLMIFGVALFAPLLVRPLARVVGSPLGRIQGLTGRLARENAIRQPQRTAVTASALMIGLALVVFVTIFAAGLRASVDTVIDQQIDAVAIVLHKDGFSPLPARIEQAAASAPGVQTVSALRSDTGKIDGVSGTTATTGVDPRTITSLLRLKWEQGSDATLRGLTDSQVVVDKGFAKANGLKVGGRIDVTTPKGRKVHYEIAGVFVNRVGLTGNVIATSASMAADWDTRDDAVVLVGGRPGADPGQVVAGLGRALSAFPAADPQTLAAFKKQQGKQVDQLLGLVFALLSLSVIVALLGIVNTLALSVHERTKELGMLRAVGMSRRQVRRMVRAEAVITAVIGAVLGTVLGIAFAAIVSRPLASQGFAFTLPVGTLALLLVLAALAGVLAAIQPARRAAKVDVLRAVTTE